MRVPITPTFEVNGALSLREAALMGSGITLLPSYIFSDDRVEGLLVRVLEGWDAGAVPVYVVYPANRHIAIKDRHFVDYITDRIRALDQA